MSVELESLAEFLTGNRQAAPALPWQTLRSEDVRVLRQWAGETLPSPSQRRLMRDLRDVLYRPFEAGDEPVERSGVPVTMLRAGRRSAAGPRLSTRQARLLLEGCEIDERVEARRAAAVIALMLLAGLRRKEVVELQRGAYDDDDGRLRIVSRSGHARSVVLEGQARIAVEGWLAVRGSWSGALIAPVDGGDGVAPRGISASAVNRLLAKRCLLTGCTDITPRDLRGRFLWQLRSASRERPRCRYFQDENGQASWVLPSMAAV